MARRARESLKNGQDGAEEGSGWSSRCPASRLAGDQGEVGHCGGEQDLEERLAAAEVARLADAQLDQPGDAMLDHLTLFAEVVEGRAPLPGSYCLELGFLGMEAHMPSVLVRNRSLEALRAQGAVAAGLGRESEGAQLGPPASRRGVPPGTGQRSGRMPGRAAAAHRLEVDLELVLGEEALRGCLGTLARSAMPACSNRSRFSPLP